MKNNENLPEANEGVIDHRKPSIGYRLRSRKRKIKAWWSDLAAWWKSYRKIPSITISATKIIAKGYPIFDIRGRLNVRIEGELITETTQPLFPDPLEVMKVSEPIAPNPIIAEELIQDSIIPEPIQLKLKDTFISRYTHELHTIVGINESSNSLMVELPPKKTGQAPVKKILNLKITLVGFERGEYFDLNHFEE